MNSMLANGFAFLAARLFIPAASFVINVAIARLWGKETLGAYVHLLSLALIFQTTAGAGVSALLTRELSSRQDEVRSLMCLGRTLGLLIGVASTAAYAGVVAILLPADRFLAAVIFGTTILPSAWVAVHEAYFQSTHSHYRITMIALVENAIKLALAGFAFVIGYGLTAICLAIAVGRVSGVALGAFLVRRDGCENAWRPRWEGLGQLARRLVAFAAIAAVSITYYRADILVVEELLGSGATGLYAAAMALFSVTLMLPEASVAAFYPRLARAFGDAPDAFRRATEFGSRLLPLFMAPFALVLGAASTLLVNSIYGVELEEAAPLLRILAATLPVHAYNAILGAAMQAAHLQRFALGLLSGTLALQFALLWLFIEHFGVAGAPVASFLSALTLSLAMTLVLRHKVGKAVVRAKALLSLSWAMAPLVAGVALQGQHLLAGLGLGLLVLAIGLWLQGFCRREPYRDALRSLHEPAKSAVAVEVQPS